MSLVYINNNEYNTNTTESLSIFLEDGVLPEELTSFRNLHHLEVRCRNHIDYIPDFLYDLIDLTFLDLSFNKISGSISPKIGKLKNLNTLILKSNNLSGSIPSSISQIKSLRNLDLSKNLLVGSIPKEIGNLKRLWYMNLSNNKLSGEIPLEIYQLIERNNLPYDAILSSNNFSFILE